jgi:hypothetical protein
VKYLLYIAISLICPRVCGIKTLYQDKFFWKIPGAASQVSPLAKISGIQSVERVFLWKQAPPTVTIPASSKVIKMRDLIFIYY